MNKAVIHILQRTLVNHFYKVNTGFFLFWFFVLFGIVAPGTVISYHLSLIQGMIQSPVFLSCVIGIWFFYTLKCVKTCTKEISEPRQNFLFILNVLPQKKQLLYMLFVHLHVYMPVLAYAGLVAIMAGRKGFYGAMIVVAIANVSMILLSAFMYRRSLQKREVRFFISLPVIGSSSRKPLSLIPLWFLWKDRKQMLLVTKLFTLLVLYGFIHLYEPERHDIRPLLLIMMLVAAVHCILIFQVRLFEEEFLSFSKNLPVSFLKRFGGSLLLYGCLLLPEFIYIWAGFPLHFLLADFPQIVLLTLCIPVCLHAILLMSDTDSDSYLRIVFAICAVLFFVILYDPGILLPVAMIGVAFVLFRVHFYDFERKME